MEYSATSGLGLSSTNFLSQLFQYRVSVFQYRNPRDFVVIWGGFNYTTRSYMGFYHPVSVYSPRCYFRHDYIELCSTLDAI